MIKKVPTSHCLDWFSASWKVAKSAYGLILGVALIAVVIQAASNKIPVLGPFIGAFISVVVAVGMLNITKKLINKQKAAFSDLFILLNDNELFKRTLPYLIITEILSIPTALIQQPLSNQNASFSETLPLLGISIILGIISLFLFYFALPLIIFQKKTLKESIPITVQAVLKNFLPILFTAILFCVFGAISLILLVLPAIFVFLPMVMPLQYIIYASILEDLQIPLELNPNQIESQEQPQALTPEEP